MTDPHFSMRAAPVQGWNVPLNGVARHTAHTDGVLPVSEPIDVCLLSHDHYDHLDTNSCRYLKDKVNLWIVPLGIAEWLIHKCDVDPSRIVDLQWWESTTVTKQVGSNSCPRRPPPIRFTCAPTQHWASRSMWDRNTRLWCSWAVESPYSKFYFGGDTGYPSDYPLFRMIGERLGPFDLSALPIGAYSPRFFMRDSHVDPSEALRVHREVGSKCSVGIHWGAFRLADEYKYEPAALLRQLCRWDDNFMAIPQGDTIVVSGAKTPKNVAKTKKAMTKNGMRTILKRV